MCLFPHDNARNGGRLSGVKAERCSRIALRQYHPTRQIIARCLFTGLALALAIGAYFAGRGADPYRQTARADNDEEAATRAEDAEDELATTIQHMANLQTSLTLEREAGAQIRSELSGAQARIGQLEHEVELYRALLDSTARQSGLAVHTLQLFEAPQASTFRFRLVLLQRSRKYDEIEGSVRLSVRGSLAGVVRELPLEDVGVPRGVKSIPMRLRYFQVFEGTFQFPEAFEPREVIVEAETSGVRRQKMYVRRDWKL